ncbi:PHD transcription factor [Histoplasma capsulatum G186AR]|uniref:PHD transcription factor n=1 Tax=Ajellomyces capsulatus TaxID=5037 RepID=A0A8H7Y9S7_AJECA|nr:PHD transcription factor [Histoplasma capsulatum]QSS70781.1 PHD transcription factor [Histoplasma capsulatum G186AR]
MGLLPSEAATMLTDLDVNPYETNAEKLPPSDRFLARHPHYGRYRPSSNDFEPDPIHCNSNDDESLRYWEAVLARCDEKTRINTLAAGKRDTFALGSVIVKSDHNSTEPTGDYSVADENEIYAIKIAEKILPDIQLPEIYLRTKLNGRDVLVQSRIPGVSLEVAWPYLTRKQKENFKKQARNIIQRINSVNDGRSSPSYVVKGNRPKEEHRLQQAEYDILFGPASDSNQNLSFTNNNMVPANIIVDKDTIVGIIGWYSAGYFGWDRAKNIHHKIRCLDSADVSSDGGVSIPDAFWRDLYDISVDHSASRNLDLKSEIKIEPPSLSLESIPNGSAADIPVLTKEPWTPRKITDLKCESMSRASSTERSSPVTSTKPLDSSPGPSTKKRAVSSTKKGNPTRKPAVKKRKLNDTESVDGAASPLRRSATPISSRASKAPVKSRKQSSLSVAGSPVPETKKAIKAPESQQDVDGDDVYEDEDSTELFCICRKPDNHTWMIGCDGGCEDWFHGKCVKINQSDADLIDKYICPACEAKKGIHTTWKRMCRLPGCRRPARISGGMVPSKYCSDEHGREFMRQKASLSKQGSAAGASPAANTSATDSRSRGSSVVVGKRRQKGVHRDDTEPDGVQPDPGVSNPRDEDEEDEEDVEDEAETENGQTEDLGSRGGILSKNDLKSVVTGVASAQEFRELGDNILPPSVTEKLTPSSSIPLEDSSSKFRTNTVSQDVDQIDFDLDAHQIQFTANERQHIDNLRQKRRELRGQLEMLQDRDTFLTLIRQRAKTILEHIRQADPKTSASSWKDICGYDRRLAWSDDEFDEWRLSEEGKEALHSGALKAADPEPDGFGDIEMQDADRDDMTVDRIARGVCIKKRCERHRQWVKVQQQDIQHEERVAREELEKCEKDTKDVIGRIVLRAYGE